MLLASASVMMRFPALIGTSSGVCRHREVTPTGIVEVRDAEGYRLLHFGSDTLQSAMLLSAPGVLVLPYTQLMIAALFLSGLPVTRWLNLGLGGGAIERFLAELPAAIEIVSVDASAPVIAVARRYFGLPEQSTIQNMSAESFLGSTVRPFDVVSCDLFDASMPATCLQSSQFFAAIRRRLSETGVLVINVIAESEAAMTNVLLVVRQSFSWTLLVDFPDRRNFLVFAMRNPAPAAKIFRQRAMALPYGLGLELASLPNRWRIIPPTRAHRDSIPL